MKSVEPDRRSPAPTLVEVAALAGVSVSTAGRALRDSPNAVAPDLAKRVLAAAAELGYVPNVVARSLRGGGPTMIGLIVGNMLDPYYGQIAETITETAESEYSMVAIVSNMQREPLLELKHCQQLWGHRVSGLILAGGGFDQWSHLDRFSKLVTQIAESGVAVASLSPRGVDIPTFSVDHEAVGAAMAARLVDAGHRRVGILLGPQQSEATQQRIHGASSTLMKAGVGFAVRHADYSPEAGAATVTAMLAESPQITGLIVGASTMAAGVLSGLAAVGRSVPRDASVVAVGSQRTPAWTSPPLTTIDVRLDECARAALAYIAARASGEGDADVPSSVLLQPGFVPGGTLAPPPSEDD